MAKTEVIPWNTFLNQQPVAIPVSSALNIPSVPNSVHSNVNAAREIWPEVLEVSDWCALGILVLAGGMWMFGNRTPALQRLIDMVIGYEIIRHGLNLLNWLRSF